MYDRRWYDSNEHTKRALDIFFNCFNVENKDNIKVISIKPAAIKTPIWNKSIAKAKTNIDIHRPIEKSLYQFSFDTNPQEFIQEVQEAFVHV